MPNTDTDADDFDFANEYDDEPDLDDSELLPSKGKPNGHKSEEPTIVEVGMALAVAIQGLTESLDRIFGKNSPTETVNEEPEKTEPPAKSEN